MSKVHYVASKPWHGSSRLQWGWLHSLQSKQTWRRQHGLRWNRNWAAVKFQNMLCGRIWRVTTDKEKGNETTDRKIAWIVKGAVSWGWNTTHLAQTQWKTCSFWYIYTVKPAFLFASFQRVLYEDWHMMSKCQRVLCVLKMIIAMVTVVQRSRNYRLKRILSTTAAVG